MRTTIRILVAALLIMIPTDRAWAQPTPPPQDLAHATLEDLLNIRITSANRKEQRAEDVPAAVYVLTQDEIRRSGIRTLPEALRLIPGVQVSRINSSNWAISIRGFNDLFANQLLILVDGRPVYNRSFSGVFWSSEDLVLADVDRVEVIRGPGGAVWGANAVNGVINIVTKPAQQTRGGLVDLDGGSLDRNGTVRYGGALGSAAYRVYTQWANHGASLLDRRTNADDHWNTHTSGLRVDWSRGAHALFVQSGFTDSESRPLWVNASPAVAAPAARQPVSDMHNTWLLSRWTYTREGGGALQVQSFYTKRTVDDSRLIEVETNADLDVEYHARIGSRHDVVAGGSLRDADYTTDGSFSYSLIPRAVEARVASALLQDEISVGDRIRVTFGSRVDHDSVSGWAVQPTARAIWNIGLGRQHVWGKISRVLRTPSASDLGVRMNYAAFTDSNGMPGVYGLVGNPAYKTERFLEGEGGYRVDFGIKASLDLTAFRGRYSRLRTHEPIAPTVEMEPAPHVFVGERFENLLDADTTGFEAVGHWTPSKVWRLDASYSGFRLTPRPDPASRDSGAATFDGNTPAHQWQLHSTTWLNDRVEVTGLLFHVGKLRKHDVPAYTRADAHVEVAISKAFTVTLTGQNLFAPLHREFSDVDDGLTQTFVRRSSAVAVRWRF